ncbi:Asp-tRNA(Asn)/Glu-tRNA(Gln) amidotransferase subunit GatC [Hazenella sp. IB182357]|uniref:Aspartyl/glutamyl-tRNA(Asn/Gln) amidotransferase subunit C n=1 Tax=Polycladospora coralii TaxID=2771432 RepID=A0A926N756_9BACL|nr:Asp-tRNA(Asn)/Glu-tRNA(Gln) amidotransferase subunit GatC [Polycladospora coralii]MBD1370762.1 Asp-tRNA(Asn)/Glu-tRNA(Gln) amidotransferase subunit GatC [Polycladospora coralii]MBS7529700.1 Asp-tRNA(Asn)/Glu-tRNA(Gln) amidotransferase subunit GatC [Polycladospora coralii]
MSIQKEDVYKVAALARLKLSEQEAIQYTNQLNDILQFAEKLNELDTTDVKPTSHVIPVSNVMRTDEVKTSLSQERALFNAPDQQDGFVKVPPVFEEE